MFILLNLVLSPAPVFFFFLPGSNTDLMISSFSALQLPMTAAKAIMARAKAVSDEVLPEMEAFMFGLYELLSPLTNGLTRIDT